MRKLATLFTDSYNEFKYVRTITLTGMLGAVSVVLGYLTLELGETLKIGFSTIANQIVYYLFGPVVGGAFGGALDILKYLIKPTGPYFPGWTFGAMLAGVMASRRGPSASGCTPRKFTCRRRTSSPGPP